MRYLTTPAALPDERICKSINLPNNRDWLGIFDRLLIEATLEWSFEPIKDQEVTPADAAAFWQTIVASFWDDPPCGGVSPDAPTPFWDEDSEVDDSAPADTQVWYGTVSDPTLPPDELSFIENLAVFAFTGFLAAATWEVGAAPAILFHTIAPKFILAMRRGDAGEIIRILVDGQDAATVDTASYSAGDVIEVPIVADPAVTTGHDLMIVQVS